MSPTGWILDELLSTTEGVCHGHSKSTTILQTLAHEAGDFLRTEVIGGTPFVSAGRKTSLWDGRC